MTWTPLVTLYRAIAVLVQAGTGRLDEAAGHAAVAQDLEGAVSLLECRRELERGDLGRVEGAQ